MLELARWLTTPLRLAHLTAIYTMSVDGVALALSVGAAHLSYRYFEKPFLCSKSGLKS